MVIVLVGVCPHLRAQSVLADDIREHRVLPCMREGSACVCVYVCVYSSSSSMHGEKGVCMCVRVVSSSSSGMHEGRECARVCECVCVCVYISSSSMHEEKGVCVCVERREGEGR